MPYLPRLLAFDLDGTLVPDGQQVVPPHTAEQLARLRRLGINAALVTGRDKAPPSALAAAQPVAVATNNGGNLEIGGELRHCRHFSEQELAAVLAHQLDNARVIAFTAKAVYVDMPPGLPVPEWLATREHHPLSEVPAHQVLKVGFFHPEVARWRDTIRTQHGQLVYTGAQAPYPEFLTVTPAGADKGAAITLMAEELGLNLSEVMVFGDSDNDEAMFKVAGQAVQVGSLPLLRGLACAQVQSPETLHLFLSDLAGQLEGRVASRPS